MTAAPGTLVKENEMPSNAKHETTEKNMTVKQAQALLPKSCRKVPGTRVGLFIDWRGLSKTAVLSDRYGRSIRDGR
jgi:hypothetical protein